ncbi:MAG: SulP family inorganic anion transporter, partial [Bacteroidota bacterium]|nr:SulP family inorganic anion transporter [Bacteroidota bacterium]
MKYFKFSRGDIFGGLTAGIVALPLALAFGVQSGVGAAYGLYGAIILGFLASIFGGTPSQISGPTGPMTVVSAATVAALIDVSGSLQSAWVPIAMCFVLVGLFQILMGIIKVGTLIKYIPYPVISGFMSGIGIIIILLQLFPSVGLVSPTSTVDVVKKFYLLFGDINIWSLIYTVLTIAIIYLFPKINKVIPGTLVALLAVTILSVLLKKEVPVIGDIPQGLPQLKIGGIFSLGPHIYSLIIEAALTLAALGAIDSLLTSVVADNVTKTKHNSNRELIGQGIGNSVAGLFAGLPGAGATMRTLVNIRSGGRNRISGVFHAVTLAIILLGAGRYAALIPNAVLAGILITVGIGIIDYKGFRHLAKVPKPDSAIMLIVLLVTVFLDLLTAVGIGMTMAVFMFMKKMSDIGEERSRVKNISAFKKEEGWSDEHMPDELERNVYVKHIEGPLFFGFVSEFQQMVQSIPEIKYVIIRMDKVPFIDQSGLYALEDAILSLESRKINVLITGLQEQPNYR